jgi:branched-chain amino acid transport system permease protein
VSKTLLAVALLVGALAAGVGIGVVFGDGAHIEVLLGRGLIFGGVNALVAVGLVFVYRAARVVNFAQAGFGAVAAVLYLCLREAWQWGFWLALGTSLLVALVAGLFVELAVLRRFARAPRLVLTVVTIALGQSLLGASLSMPEWFGFEPDPETGISYLPTTAPSTPVDGGDLRWGDVVFSGNQVLTAIVAAIVLAALFAFLRFTKAGTALRGAAENRDRAGQLGIDVDGLSSLVWVIVAALGATAALLSTFAGAGSLQSTVQQSAAAFGVGTLLRGLAPAVVARMDHLGVAAAGAYAVGIVEESVRFATSQSATVDAILLVVVVGALLAQRRGQSRVDADDASSWEATAEVRAIPRELASLPVVRRGVRRALWTVAAVLALYPWVMSPSQTNTGALYAIYGIVGISLVVHTGWGGQISLGQFGFVAVGAVFGGWMTSEAGLPFLLAAPLASLACAVVAVLVGLPALRIKGLFLAVSTMAFAVVCSTFVVNPRYFDWLLPESVDRPKILWVDTGAGERAFYYVCLACLGVAIFAAGGLRQSRTGRLLIAMRDNERAAQSFTINLVRTRLTAFAFSGFLAGLAGVLYAHHQAGVSPGSFDAARSVDIFLMSVLGGLGSVYSVLVGAVYLGTVGVVLSSDGAQLLASSTGVLLILVFFPTGLGSLVFRVRDGWLRRIAMRNRIFVPSLAGDRLREGDEALVPIGERPDEAADVPTRYELVGSVIGDQGKSQYTKVWRY